MYYFSYCKICLIDPGLIQHPLGLFIVWLKKIRNRCLYLDKLSSYSGSFYSGSSPTHTLPSHDLFTLEFLWHMEFTQNAQYRSTDANAKKKKVGVASDFCFLTLAS